MKRVEFTLTMPGRGQAVSSSFGEGRRYAIVRSMTNVTLQELLGGRREGTWFHHWDDGWVAQVTARILGPGERAARSDGFAGYDWMVDNILAHGRTDRPA